MNKMLERIKEMHSKFGITSNQVGFSSQEKTFRVMAMEEEIQEFEDASAKEDELDALVDLVVFALGTAERQGLLGVFEQAFNRVMDANMKKEIGQNQKRGSFKLDLVKPEGWVAPDLKDLVILGMSKYTLADYLCTLFLNDHSISYAQIMKYLFDNFNKATIEELGYSELVKVYNHFFNKQNDKQNDK